MITSRMSSLAKPHVAGMAGTIAYVAPEQAVAAPTADHRADIYALGATFYHLITGRVLFPAPSVMDMLRKHASEAPTPPHEVAPQVPNSVSRVILKMLAKDPRERHQTYEQLFVDFRYLHDNLGPRMRKTEPVIELPEDVLEPPTPAPSGLWGRLRSRFGGRPSG
jgi:serine/threonine protein kinase